MEVKSTPQEQTRRRPTLEQKMSQDEEERDISNSQIEQFINVDGLDSMYVEKEKNEEPRVSERTCTTTKRERRLKKTPKRKRLRVNCKKQSHRLRVDMEAKRRQINQCISDWEARLKKNPELRDSMIFRIYYPAVYNIQEFQNQHPKIICTMDPSNNMLEFKVEGKSKKNEKENEKKKR